MRGFTSSDHAQRFLHVHGVIQNLFRVGLHLLRSVHHRMLRAPLARLSGHEKPILSNRSSKLPIEPVGMGLDTVCINSGQMVRKRFPDHSGP